MFLISALFIDKTFNILFLTFFFFGIYKKKSTMFIISFILFALNLTFYGFEVSGKPKGYLLDTLGIFAACFSPLIFIYFFYVLYRLTFKDDKSLLWFLGSITFVFCLLLSLRQKLYLEDFLPFCVICTPLLVKTLMQSYRVRLPRFRLKYKIFIECAFAFLLFCYFSIIANNILYFFIKNPNNHFANNYHIVKELAYKLNQNGINSIHAKKELQKRLLFYGIKDSKKLYIREFNVKDDNFKIINIKLGKNVKKYKIYEK